MNICSAAMIVSVGLLGCDDTGKAIKQEVKEIDKQEVKRDLKEAAATVGSAVEKVAKKVDEGMQDAAKVTEKAVDKVDKKAAEEIRRD